METMKAPSRLQAAPFPLRSLAVLLAGIFLADWRLEVFAQEDAGDKAEKKEAVGDESGEK
jgi:hypothetical protein